MAADVSSLVRVLQGCKKEGDGKRDLVTRDLLGGGEAVIGSEVDLELRIPVGWERRLDLLSGRTYLHKLDRSMVFSHGDDLNLALPPPSSAVPFPDPDASAWPSASSPSVYQSVCTLEKVKSALERAGRGRWRKEQPLVPAHRSTSPPSSSINTTSSIKRRANEDVRGAEPPPDLERLEAEEMAVAGCPTCLLYVLVSATDPKCPRCATHVPVNGEPRKRPKFDLNSPTHDDDLDPN